MQQVQASVMQPRPPQKSPFSSVLSGVLGILTPFIPGGAITAGAIQAGADTLAGGSPFSGIQKMAGAGMEELTGSKPDAPQEKPPQQEQGADPAPPASPEGAAQNPYMQDQEQKKQAIIQNLASQYPDAFAYLAQNPGILSGGQEFLKHIQAFGQLQKQQQMGGQIQ